MWDITVNKVFKKGFTIAEMVTVIAIIVILTGASFVVFQSLRERNKLSSTSESIKSFILEAREIAMTGRGVDYDSGAKYVRVWVLKNSGNPVLKIDVLKANGVLVKNVRTLQIDAKTLTYKKLNYVNATTIQLCNDSISNNCFFDFVFQDINGGQIKDYGIANFTPEFEIANSDTRYNIKVDPISGVITIKNI